MVTVLIVEHDETIAGLVADVLRDEGFEAFWLANLETTAIQDQVALLKPAAVLLAGCYARDYGHSWDSAAWLHMHHPAIPVIMFTGHSANLTEAQSGETARSRLAAFAGFVAKPFDLSTLVDVVARAVYRERAVPGAAAVLLAG